MLFKTIFIFLTATVFQMQVLVESSSLEEAQSELKILEETANTILSTAFSAYVTVSHPLTNNTIATKTHDTDVIQSAAEKSLQEYTSIKQAALDAGVNITGCLYIGDHIVNLGPDYERQYSECIDAVLDSTLEYIHSLVIEAIDSVWSIIFENDKQLVSCGSYDGACLDNLILKIDNDVHAARQSVAFLIGSYTAVYSVYPSNIQQSCVDKYVPTAVTRGELLVDEFQQCVDFFSQQ